MLIELDGRRPRVAPDAFVASGAVLVGAVTIGARASIWFSAVLRADQNEIVVGADSNLQDGVIVHCDKPDWPGYPVHVGERVTVGHGAVLHGCTIADEAVIGSGSVVLDGARIGTGSFVGAGATVLPGFIVPAGTLAAGSPARVRRELTAAERKAFARAHQLYLDMAAQYRAMAGEDNQPGVSV